MVSLPRTTVEDSIRLGIRSFNRDPESSATVEFATCRQPCWQMTAGSAFWIGESVTSVLVLPTRAPRREVAGNGFSKIEADRGNLALGRG